MEWTLWPMKLAPTALPKKEPYVQEIPRKITPTASSSHPLLWRFPHAKSPQGKVPYFTKCCINQSIQMVRVDVKWYKQHCSTMFVLNGGVLENILYQSMASNGCMLLYSCIYGSHVISCHLMFLVCQYLGKSSTSNQNGSTSILLSFRHRPMKQHEKKAICMTTPLELLFFFTFISCYVCNVLYKRMYSVIHQLSYAFNNMFLFLMQINELMQK